MKKFRIVSAVIALSMVFTLFAASPLSGATVKVTLSAKNAQLLKIYQEEAKKYGIVITGLSLDGAKVKIVKERQIILDREAKKVGIVIKGLNPNEARAKIIAERNVLKMLLDEAKKVNVEITGLSKEKARERIIEGRVVKTQAELLEKAKELGIDITDLTNAEAYEKIKAADDAKKAEEKLPKLQEKATKMGIDPTGLNAVELQAQIDEAIKKMQSEKVEFKADDYEGLMKVLTDQNITAEEKKSYVNMIEAEAKKLGVDITGLNFEEALKKIKAKIEAAKTVENVSPSMYSISDDFAKLLYSLKIDDKITVDHLLKSAAFLSIKEMASVSKLTYEQAKQNILKPSEDNWAYEIYIKCKTLDEFKKTVRSAFVEGTKKDAEEFGLDINGLSETEIMLKIEAAQEIRYAKELQEMNETAAKLGVDITGLSKEQAWAKIKALFMEENSKEEQERKIQETKQWLMVMLDEARNMGMDVTGIDVADRNLLMDGEKVNELKERINAFRDQKEDNSRSEEAKKLGIDISGLKGEEADNAIMNAYAAKYGVDITGLSRDQAWAKLKPAMQAIDEAQRKAEDEARLKQEEEQNKLLEEQRRAEEKANQAPVIMTREGIFLQMAAGKLGLDTNLDVEPTRKIVGEALGMDLTGLMGDELIAKLNEGLATKGLKLD